MELGSQIKRHRTRLGLSQEDLAQRLLVSRQTVSNWETGRTYPDVQNLLLLSELFDASIDQLVKGDVEVMKTTLEQDVRRMNQLTYAMVGLVLTGALGFIVLVWLLPEPSGVGGLSVGKIAGIALAVPLFAGGLAAGLAIERIKRDHDLVTYREIVAFTESGGAQKIAEPQGFSRRHPKLAILAKLACGAVAGALVATVSLGVLRVLGA